MGAIRRQAARARKWRAIAGDLRRRIIELYQVRVAPGRRRISRPAAADFATHCAVCHGAAGRGDGPAAKGLTPPPADLTDAARQGQHSVFGLYNTITLGIKGTAMTGFPALSEAQRWALAFHVSTLASSGDERARAAPRSGRAARARASCGDLRALVMATPRDVTARRAVTARRCWPTCASEPEAVAIGPRVAPSI